MDEKEKINKEQKRNRWLIIAISYWLGIGLMSILNIYKTVYTQNTL